MSEDYDRFLRVGRFTMHVGGGILHFMRRNGRHLTSRLLTEVDANM